MVRADRCRHPCRHPYQKTLLKSGCKGVVDSHRIDEPALSGLYFCGSLNCILRAHRISSRETPAVNAFLVARKVNASSSRGKSATIGEINQPSPGGTSRV